MSEQREQYTTPAADGPPRRELTPRQRMVTYLAVSVANDMDGNGTRAEQTTASLLRVAADAIQYGYEAELVALVRAWRLEREAGAG